MVLFASPGMLHAGNSLLVFTKWCHDAKNVIIMPGYCVAGTVGAKVLAGEKNVDIDRFKTVEVNMQVQNLSFSAHADAKGILNLITMCSAKNVMLVHGEKNKMEVLKNKIITELNIPCYNPANGETTVINTHNDLPVVMTGEIPERGRFEIPKDTVNGNLKIVGRDPDRYLKFIRLFKTLDLKFKASIDALLEHLRNTVPMIELQRKKNMIIGHDYYIEVGNTVSMVYSDGQDVEVIKVLAAINRMR